MSSNVTLHMELGEISESDQLAAFQKLLELIAVPSNLTRDGKVVSRFNHLKVCDGSSFDTLLDISIDTNDADLILERLKSYQGKQMYYEIDSAFDCKIYDPQQDILQNAVRPLTIYYYGQAYGWKGHDFKSYGALRIDFSNTKVFQIPQILIEIVQGKASRSEDCTKWLRIIARLGSNFDAVKTVAKLTIERINPAHLLVCTDAEVHPLTCHTIYHRDLQAYAEDLKKIVALHEHGGTYFHEVTPNEPAYREARKQSAYGYGYLRGPQGNRVETDFLRKVQPFVDCISSAPHRVHLSDTQIRECFQGLDATVVEAFHSSYFLSVTDPPFAYLEEPYFKLFELVCQQT